MRLSIKDFYRTGIALWMVCISLSTISCGSGSSGTSESVPSVEPANSVSISRNKLKSTGDMIAVDVILNSEKPVFGAAFDVVFDPSVVEVARKPDNSIDFSPPEGSVWKHLFVTLQEGQDGRVIVGASRGGGTPPLTGDVPLVTLKFKIPSGKSPLTFSNNDLIDATGQPIEAFKDRWYGIYLAP